MTNILVINSSAAGDASVSAGLISNFIETVRAANPAATIVTRDVGTQPLPHLSPAATIVDRSSLADLIVLSTALREPVPGDPLPLAGDVAINARTPVLVVPAGTTRFDVTGKAFVAWNGSPEAAHALKASLPMLRLAASVVIATVEEPHSGFLPPLDACEYLSRHGVKAELLAIERGKASTADALLTARDRTGAGYVVMGAYGHSRMREFVLGGVTREMLRGSPVPMFLAH